MTDYTSFLDENSLWKWICSYLQPFFLSYIFFYMHDFCVICGGCFRHKVGACVAIWLWVILNIWFLLSQPYFTGLFQKKQLGIVDIFWTSPLEFLDFLQSQIKQSFTPKNSTKLNVLHLSEILKLKIKTLEIPHDFFKITSGSRDFFMIHSWNREIPCCF